MAILDWRDQTYYRLELNNPFGLFNSPDLSINHFHTICMMQTRQDLFGGILNFYFITTNTADSH